MGLRALNNTCERCTCVAELAVPVVVVLLDEASEQRSGVLHRHEVVDGQDLQHLGQSTEPQQYTTTRNPTNHGIAYLP